MKSLNSYLLLLSMIVAPLMNAQVKIGDNPEAIDQGSILELESNSKALVITRLSEAAMNAITPLHGALVYNTDAGCVFYYDGNQWSNLCEDNNTTNVSLTLEDAVLTLTDSDGNEVSVPLAGAVEQTFTADPVVNFRETIIITQTGNNFNFEVGLINGLDNIAQETINGNFHLQDDTVTSDKLAPNSVGQDELEENAVADSEIDYSLVTLNDFTNDAGYITTTEIISPDVGNDIIDQGGAFYDDSLLQDAITANTTAINNHVNGDQDTADDNEVVTQFEIVGDELILNEAGVPYSVSLAGFNNSGSDDQTLAEVLTEGNSAGNQLIRDVNDPQIAQDAATKNYVDNAIASIPAGSDNQNLSGATLSPANLLTIDIQNGNSTSVDLSSLAVSGADGNDFITGGNLTGSTLNLTGTGSAGASINLAPLNTDNQNLTGATLNGANLLTIDIQNGGSTSVDLSSLAGGAADGVITGVNLNGTDLEFTGTNGGFNGNVPLASLQDGFEANTDNQTATDVPFTPYVTLAGPNTQLAIQQLKDELDAATIGGGGENPTNELQDIQLTGTIVTLTIPATLGNQIDLDPTFVTETELASFSVNDADFDPNNEIELPVGGTAGQVLSTDGAGTYSWVDDQNTAATIVSADAGQILTAGGDGGALLTNAVVDATFATDAELAAAITASETADNDTDDQNEIELPVGGTNGQILSTDGTGTYSWVDDQDSGGLTGTAGSIFFADTDGTPTENNPQLRWDNSASRMSIGNISPQSKLDVDGQIQARNGFAANIGSAGQPSFGFSTEATMGMYRAGTSQLGFSTGGTEALRIDGTQTVIIQRDIELQEDLIDVNNSTGNTGQILSSLGTGNGVQWINAPTGGAVTTDGTTITGDGSITPLSVVNQGIGSAQIANQAVTNGKIPDNEIRPIKIETSGVTDGFVLTANGGVANWAAVSVSGDGNDFVTTGSFDQGTQNLTLNVTNQAPFTIDLQNLVTQNELTAAESGLVITTTQIQNLTILNEDINPGAAIDGSKISPVFTANVETTGTFISGGTTLNVPDYVFENYFNGFSKLNDSYKFKELSEIEAFIKKHKHLPGITSAYQAQKDGQWNLSQSNLQNLEKIEELFLHTIEQEKKIKALQQENTTLSEELDALKKDMALIKEMLAAKKE